MILREQRVNFCLLSYMMKCESQQFHNVVMSHAFPVVVRTKLSVTAAWLQPPTHVLPHDRFHQWEAALWMKQRVVRSDDTVEMLCDLSICPVTQGF